MSCRAEFELQTPVQVFGDRLSGFTGMFCGSSFIWGGLQVRSEGAGCKLLMPPVFVCPVKLCCHAVVEMEPCLGLDGPTLWQIPWTRWELPVAGTSAFTSPVLQISSLKSMIRNKCPWQHPVVPLYFGGFWTRWVLLHQLCKSKVKQRGEEGTLPACTVLPISSF